MNRQLPHGKAPPNAAAGPPPSTAEFDSLDMLLGASGSPPAAAGSRPFTGTQQNKLAGQPAWMPAPRPSLFADSDSLLLPGDEEWGAGDTTAGVAAAQSQARLTIGALQQPGQAIKPAGLPVRALAEGHTSHPAPVPPQRQPTHQPVAPHPQQQLEQQNGQQAASLQAQIDQLEQEAEDARQRCAAAEGRGAEARQALSASQAEVAALQERVAATNEAAVEQILAEVDRLAAAKVQAEREVAQLHDRLADSQRERNDAGAKLSAADADLAAAREDAATARQQAAESINQSSGLKAQLALLGEQLAAAQGETTAAVATARQASVANHQLQQRQQRQQQLLQQREAKLAAATQHGAALAKQLAAAEAHAATLSEASGQAVERQGQAEAAAAAAELRAQGMQKQLDECRRHLASGQQVRRGQTLWVRACAKEERLAVAWDGCDWWPAWRLLVNPAGPSGARGPPGHRGRGAGCGAGTTGKRARGAAGGA